MVVRWLGVADASRSEHVAEHQSDIAARREALDSVSQLPDLLDPETHDVSSSRAN
jgi:CPA1 family monovalent cation:H+ antiporter